MSGKLRDLAKTIDHSLLNPTLTDVELSAGCECALRRDVAAVCIKPYAVPLAAGLLRGSAVAVCTVIGFPHGSNAIEIKIEEAERALEDGAVELDMVVNLGKVLGEDWSYVTDEIGRLNEVTTQGGGLLKVIFENDYLPRDAFKEKLCAICSQEGAGFVKTSTGYGFVKQADGSYAARGATEHDVELMRRCCSSRVQVKAAGGVRTLDQLLRMRELGAARVGATATEAILKEAEQRGYR